MFLLVTTLDLTFFSLYLSFCSEDGHDSQSDDNMFQENITFGQLG